MAARPSETGPSRPCRPSSDRSGWTRRGQLAAMQALEQRSDEELAARAEVPRRRAGDPRRARRGALRRARPRASTSARRSPPRARRSACSCGAWPRRRSRSPSAARTTSRRPSRSWARQAPSSRQLLRAAPHGPDLARRPARACGPDDPRRRSSCSRSSSRCWRSATGSSTLVALPFGGARHSSTASCSGSSS